MSMVNETPMDVVASMRSRADAYAETPEEGSVLAAAELRFYADRVEKSVEALVSRLEALAEDMERAAGMCHEVGKSSACENPDASYSADFEWEDRAGDGLRSGPSRPNGGKCRYGKDDHTRCQYCTKRGYCSVTMLTSSPPQYEKCEFLGRGYAPCSEA